MPPRIHLSAVTGAFNLTSLLQALPTSLARHPNSFTKCTSCLFSTSPFLQAKRRGRKRTNQRKDPYRLAQAQQRKAANLQKRQVLQADRAAAMGDPVRSTPTSFLASLNLSSSTATDSNSPKYLNYALTPATAKKQLDHSKWLTEPLPKQSSTPTPSPADEEQLARRLAQHEDQHVNATRAIDSITSLVNSSNKDRTRINIARCIEAFGRHNTDALLPPKPASLGPSKSIPTLLELSDEAPSEEDILRTQLLSELAAIPKRAGPDTGSSEVQIAILTTKINVIADNLKANKDKHNKRALRLLVHRRQKLLNYLRRKERGGPRWQNLVEQLGINDAMWKGEISL